MSTVAKAVTAFFTSLGTWGATAFADGHLDPVEWFGLCGVVVATAAVWSIPNAVARARDTRGRFVGNEAGVTLSEVCLTVIAVIFVLWAFGVVPTK